MAEMSILSSFGAGSGIDTKALVGNLTAATRTPRQAAINERSSTNTARLSAIAALSSSLTAVASSTTTRARTLADADITTFAEDLVGAINEMRGALNDATRAATVGGSAGALNGDGGGRALARSLSSLAGTSVVGATTYPRLSDIGVSTARDGSLVLDPARLSAALTADPAAVKALLGIGANATTGIGRTLTKLRDAMVGSNGALTASKIGYGRAATAIAKTQAKLDGDMTLLSDRLTRSFSAMDRQVASIKASQAYITQTVDSWSSRR